jgi:hypothetical protein
MRIRTELHLVSEILEVRPSKSRPGQGLLKVRTTTFNQNGEPVQILITNLVVPRRPAYPRSSADYPASQGTAEFILAISSRKPF